MEELSKSNEQKERIIMRGMFSLQKMTILLSGIAIFLLLITALIKNSATISDPNVAPPKTAPEGKVDANEFLQSITTPKKTAPENTAPSEYRSEYQYKYIAEKILKCSLDYNLNINYDNIKSKLEPSVDEFLPKSRKIESNSKSETTKIGLTPKKTTNVKNKQKATDNADFSVSLPSRELEEPLSLPSTVETTLSKSEEEVKREQEAVFQRAEKEAKVESEKRKQEWIDKNLPALDGILISNRNNNKLTEKWVTNLAEFACDVFNNNLAISLYIKEDKRITTPLIIDFHIKKWEGLIRSKNEYDLAEQNRYDNEIIHQKQIEERRVLTSKREAERLFSWIFFIISANLVASLYFALIGYIRTKGKIC